jgi:hypothetical protein
MKGYTINTQGSIKLMELVKSGYICRYVKTRNLHWSCAGR